MSGLGHIFPIEFFGARQFFRLYNSIDNLGFGNLVIHLIGSRGGGDISVLRVERGTCWLSEGMNERFSQVTWMPDANNRKTVSNADTTSVPNEKP